jgi:hypothetical protein
MKIQAASTIALLFATLGLPSMAEAKHEKVRAQLLAYDQAPDRATLEQAAAPSEAEAALMEIHGDPSMAEVIRLRALDALGLFDSLSVRGYLHQLTSDSKASTVHRLRAATAMVHAFGDGALTTVRPVLTNPSSDGDLRVAIADALVRYAGPAGRELVRRASILAKDPARMDAMEKILDPNENPLPQIR